jgi:hypothetical protein
VRRPEVAEGPEEVEAEQRHPEEHGDAGEVEDVAERRADVGRNA